ncbi:trehalose-phosphatase [Novosphingobium aquimarinum]|uniref:trehalose-phosphatase n=1 Tax=Novosphingobium aquimarinum TaxID=2682494 RepID=UPI0012EC4D6E|nr:trehalose-phosphatase [Novosphingobium aquimarinum]
MTIDCREAFPESEIPIPSDLPRPSPIATGEMIALFLDFDGTLVEIADHPESIHVADGLPAMLEALSTSLDGRMAIVSGRALSDLDRFLGPVAVAMAGSHGGEFREAGARDAIPLAKPLPAAVLENLQALAKAHGDLLVEAKPFSAAIHYRTNPSACEALLEATQAMAAANGLKLKHGKMVIELVMPGSDKGTAVRRFMDLPGFKNTRPVFAGDDVTDEDAFKAVAPYGGGGILVGPMRETAAVWRLESVAAVHAWLGAVTGDAA